jgi:hypothetical protein
MIVFSAVFYLVKAELLTNSRALIIHGCFMQEKSIFDAYDTII